MIDFTINPASFKDPAGFIFEEANIIYRQVNQSYSDNYNLLIQSGLYNALTGKKWLISHTEIDENLTSSKAWFKTLLPEQLPFISYPYEWSFDMLKDAALLTLKINKKAIEYGMVLKDATPFNIQFHHGKPIFIDSLSFEKYDETTPWVAYRQFCECFLFPLLLTHYARIDANKLLSIYTEGIPVSITAGLLPFRSRFNLNVWMHVFLQNSLQQKNNGQKPRAVLFSKKKLFLLLEGLIDTLKKLSFTNSTTWSNYYEETILSKEYLREKEIIFNGFLNDISFKTVLDVGANDGFFSHIGRQKATMLVAADFDSKCINRLYQNTKKEIIINLLPLIIDVSNPTPGIGFNNEERTSFIGRSGFDLTIALALIHHLIFSKNIPLTMLPSFFTKLTNHYLIIEFIPLQDEKVQLLLLNKASYHSDYSQENFEKIFQEYFIIEKKQQITGTGRVLYQMKKRSM